MGLELGSVVPTNQRFRQLGHDNTYNPMVLIIGIENAGVT